MERFCTPNLPSTRVRRAFISQLMPDQLVSELNDMGIRTHKLGKTPNINKELAYHPDILLNNFRKGLWLCENDPKYLPIDLPRSIFRESEKELETMYPLDCLFNNYRLGKTLVCSRRADDLIQAYAKYEGIKIAFVPQGYAKCCSIPINEYSVITCDPYIGKTLRQLGFDVLTVKDSDEIGLRGYSHGLIGGCAAMLAPDLLGFTGDLNKYKYGDDIRDFCANHGVDAFSLTSEPMYDYGGILPITELVPKAEEPFTKDCGLNMPL